MRISDWSSDVCSSDLSDIPSPRCRSDWISLQDVRHPTPKPPGVNAAPSQYSHFPAGSCCTIASFGRGGGSSRNVAMKRPDPTGNLRNLLPFAEIGRESCRERVCQYV